MSEYEQKKKLHDEVMDLWKRFQENQRKILVLQADVDQLDKDNIKCGKKIYELYKKSSAGFDEELSVIHCKGENSQ